MTSKVNRHKEEILRSFDGKIVTLGIGSRLIVEETGRLEIDEGTEWITLVTTKARVLPLGDIRWITDPQTRQRVGGPW